MRIILNIKSIRKISISYAVADKIQSTKEKYSETLCKSIRFIIGLYKARVKYFEAEIESDRQTPFHPSFRHIFYIRSILESSYHHLLKQKKSKLEIGEF